MEETWHGELIDDHSKGEAIRVDLKNGNVTVTIGTESHSFYVPSEEAE